MGFAHQGSVLDFMKSKAAPAIERDCDAKAPKFKHPSSSYEGKIERAVFMFKDPHGFMADKMMFLKSKGLTDTEILEALNIASNGELLRAAGIDQHAGQML